MCCERMIVAVSYQLNLYSRALYSLIWCIQRNMRQSDQSTTRTTGVTATKHESPSLVSQLPIDIDQEQSINLKYEIKQTGDLEQTKHLATQIGRVAGNKISINYPVTNAPRLEDLKLIESQFAHDNKIDDPDPTLVDTTILHALPHYLAEEEVDLPDDSIKAARVRAHLLKRARGMQHTTDLLEYLENNSSTAQALGFPTTSHIGSQSTLSRTATDWGVGRQAVRDAICRLRHLLLRNGILPDQFNKKGYKVNQLIPYDSQIPDRLWCQGLVNYTELLLRQFDDISFGRGPGVTYSPREIIAALAQMAIHDNRFKGRQLAKWHYESDIITFQRIRQIISNKFNGNNIWLAKSSLERLDKKLHQAIFEFADTIGLFNRPMNISLDPTWVPVTDKVEDTPGAIKNPTLGQEAEGGFTFPMALTFTPTSSLSLGVRYVTQKSSYANAFRKILSRIKSFGDIGWILADREFDSAEMIRLLRSVAGNKWIIRLREHHEVITSDVSRLLEDAGKAQVSIGDQNVNVFSKKYESTTNHPLNKSDNMILLSGMPIDNTDPTSLAEKYRNRWSIETYIRQIKHDFSPSVTEEHAPINQFVFTMASIFYNIWQIVNQSVTPMYGLPLCPQYYDVLVAIVQSTISRRNQFHPQIDEVQW